jgi:hypothetical protein
MVATRLLVYDPLYKSIQKQIAKLSHIYPMTPPLL